MKWMTKENKKRYFNAAVGFFLFSCIFFVVLCSSCSVAPRLTEIQAANKISEVGLVDVIFVNPNLGIYGHIFMFDGSEEVKIIPDPRNGQWQFSRSAIAEFKINPASGSNWWEEKCFKLPINHTYLIFVVGERFWGAIVDRPYGYVLRVGDNPFYTQYYRHSPRGGLVNCGGYVEVPYFQQYSQPLNLEFTITPGEYVAAGLHYIFGR